jgi:hypothetical protein
LRHAYCANASPGNLPTNRTPFDGILWRFGRRDEEYDGVYSGCV